MKPTRLVLLLAAVLLPTLALAQAAAPAPAAALVPAAVAINWQTIAVGLGVWAFLASLVNRSLWPKPAAPRWAVVLHYALVDAPALLPAANFRGIFGLPINVPLYPSQPIGPAPKPPVGPAAIGAIALLLFAGCAHYTPPADQARCAAAILSSIVSTGGMALADAKPSDDACRADTITGKVDKYGCAAQVAKDVADGIRAGLLTAATTVPECAAPPVASTPAIKP